MMPGRPVRWIWPGLCLILIGLQLAILAHGMLGGIHDRTAWADRDLMRAALFWQDMLPYGTEFSGSHDTRLPGPILPLLWSLMLPLGPGGIYAVQFVLALAGVLALGLHLRRRFGAIGATAGALAVLTAWPVINVLLFLWHIPLFLPFLLAAAVLMMEAPARPILLAPAAGATALAMQIHPTGIVLLLPLVWLAVALKPGRRVVALALAALALPYLSWLVADLLNGFAHTRQLWAALLLEKHLYESPRALRNGIVLMGQGIAEPNIRYGAHGWAALLLSLPTLAGIGLLLARRLRTAWPMLAMAAANLGLIVVFVPGVLAGDSGVRCLLPMLPLIAVLAAAGAQWLSRRWYGAAAVLLILALQVASTASTLLLPRDWGQTQLPLLSQTTEALGRLEGWSPRAAVSRTAVLSNLPFLCRAGWCARHVSLAREIAALPGTDDLSPGRCAALIRKSRWDMRPPPSAPEIEAAFGWPKGEVAIAGFHRLPDAGLLLYDRRGGRCPSGFTNPLVATPEELAAGRPNLIGTRNPPIPDGDWFRAKLFLIDRDTYVMAGLLPGGRLVLHADALRSSALETIDDFKQIELERPRLRLDFADGSRRETVMEPGIAGGAHVPAPYEMTIDAPATVTAMTLCADSLKAVRHHTPMTDEKDFCLPLARVAR